MMIMTGMTGMMILEKVIEEDGEGPPEEGGEDVHRGDAPEDAVPEVLENMLFAAEIPFLQ